MYECTLTYKGVDPNLDFEAANWAFFEADMSEIMKWVRRREGLLYIAISVEGLIDEDEFELTKAIRVAQSIVGDATLVAVGPDLVNAENIAYWLQLNDDHLDTTMSQEWFPEPVDENHMNNWDEDFWHFDEVLLAIKENGTFVTDDADDLLKNAKAARVLNRLLEARAA